MSKTFFHFPNNLRVHLPNRFKKSIKSIKKAPLSPNCNKTVFVFHPFALVKLFRSSYRIE